MAQRNEERRNEILSTAYKLLSETSYEKMSLSSIAAGAGIKKSLLQRYYPQKISIIKDMLTKLLEVSYSYLTEFSLPYSGEEDAFRQISDFNLLFFAAAANDYQMQRFLLATMASPEILDVWIDTIVSWLQPYGLRKDFSVLELRCALCFAMGGSMHLFQHQDELGIDYRFFCPRHVRSILEMLRYEPETIEEICTGTEQWFRTIDVKDFIAYCRERIPWIRG